MILHVLTACTRPVLLGRLGEALATAEGCGITLRWHVAFDVRRAFVGGQAVKNRLLDGVADGWVWVCDDDNLPHPRMFPRLVQLIQERPEYAGFLVAQDRGPGGVLPARRPTPGHVDVAQLVVRREAIGGLRIPETYDGDGAWIAALFDSAPLMLVDEILAYHNAGDWWHA